MKCKQHAAQRVLIRLLVIFYIPWIAAAPVYKSKDADGNVTYSSEPPTEAKQVQEVAVPKSPPASTGNGDDSVDSIKQKANALEQENAARAQDMKKQQQETNPVVEESPVHQHKTTVQNKPSPQLPGGGGAIKPKPAPASSGKK